MRAERIKEEKSHNVGKTDENIDGCVKAVPKKRMTYEERSAQVDREIRLIIIFALTVIAVITLIILNIIKTRENRNDGQTNNSEYVGENEIDINELSSMKMKEEGLPEFNLYEETEGMDKQDRFKYYADAVKNIIYPSNVRSSEVLVGLTEEKQREWNALYNSIELEESKKGNSENVVELETLSSAEYRTIYELCHKEYLILPQGNMAVRYGRNAGDALIEGLKEGVDYQQLIKDFNISNEGYVTSFHYRDCEQKIADGCYWAGHNFEQFLYHIQDFTEQEKEHSTLMAYFYSFYGCENSVEDGVQHRNDLKKMNEETRNKLVEDYGYPETLFN